MGWRGGGYGEGVGRRIGFSETCRCSDWCLVLSSLLFWRQWPFTVATTVAVYAVMGRDVTVVGVQTVQECH